MCVRPCRCAAGAAGGRGHRRPPAARDARGWRWRVMPGIVALVASWPDADSPTQRSSRRRGGHQLRRCADALMLPDLLRRQRDLLRRRTAVPAR